ncbi:BtrH N-terminal domain-containing protein [Zhihengliuella halotolerans]|uniref:Butirosin biosynthesis protein H-like n=1 Tax=Zhihengliuella halotolerans TaxID=370736 RepID=A0A4Q8AB66_9MICC|nr:BtrH N-terminal domain-containing protein [Zhihengliuella halotolerans]RZU60891.1 butirosin biosynthesis protein H-like [Zhihengliuella halotolerans]
MPQPKQLKKLARERMARTGETYTQARKAVLAGAPAPGARRPTAPAAAQPHDDGADLPEYPAPEGVVQYDAGLWQRVLTQAGVTDPRTSAPLSEALLAGLAGGIGFMVFTFEYASGTTATVVTRAHPEPYIENLLERVGVPVRQVHTSSSKAAQTHLDEGLDAGRAVVVRVTETVLPWVDSDVPDTDAESVDLAVLGEDEDGKYLIDDGSGALRVLRPGQLSAARSRRKKDKNWQAWVPESVQPREVELVAAIAAAVRETSARLLGESELAGIPAHFAKNFGVAGMRTWASKLTGTGARDWPALFGDADRLETALEMISGFFDGGRYSGAGGLRGLYARFLEEAAERDGLGPLGAAAGAYRDLAADWDELIALLRPEAAREKRFAATGDYLAELAGRVEALADAEQAAAEALRDAAAALDV